MIEQFRSKPIPIASRGAVPNGRFTPVADIPLHCGKRRFGRAQVDRKRIKPKQTVRQDFDKV
jgi:hypothetical protein